MYLTAIHFVGFEISREKGDFLKTIIDHLGLNGGSRRETGSLSSRPLHQKGGFIL